MHGFRRSEEKRCLPICLLPKKNRFNGVERSSRLGFVFMHSQHQVGTEVVVLPHLFEL